MKKWALWQKIIGIILLTGIILFSTGAIYVYQSTYTASEVAQKQSEQATHEKDYDLYSEGKSSELGLSSILALLSRLRVIVSGPHKSLQQVIVSMYYICP